MGAVAPTLIGFAVVVRFLVAHEWRFGGTLAGRELVEFVFQQPWDSDVLKTLATFVWSATLLGGTAAVVIRWLIGTTEEK